MSLDVPVFETDIKILSLYLLPEKGGAVFVWPPLAPAGVAAQLKGRHARDDKLR